MDKRRRKRTETEISTVKMKYLSKILKYMTTAGQYINVSQLIPIYE